MTSRPSKTRLALLAAVLLAAPGSPARATKLDALLITARGQALAQSRTAGAGAPAPTFAVLVRLAPGATLAGLRAAYPQAAFGSQSGPIVTAHVPDAALTAFESDPRVLTVEGARRLSPTLDVVRSNQTSGGLYLGATRNAAAADLANVDGTGVVVGVVDTGIDFRHADFVTSGGLSRVKYLWDQTDAAGPAPSGFPCTNITTPVIENDCGTEWTNAQLNASLPSGGPVREADTVGHGTHVAGIAAGNGRGFGGPLPSGTFVGLAPKADLVIVKTDFTTLGILDAINYVAARAAALGERAVINLSLGGQIDAHDGTSNFDVGVAAVAASTPVVVAMGNDGTAESSFPHASAPNVAFGQAVTVNATASAGGRLAELDFWTGSPNSASLATFTVAVTVNGTSCGSKTDGAGTGGTPISCAGQSVYIENDSSLVGKAGGGNTFGDGTNTTNDREMYAAVYNASGFSSSLPITITFTCTASGGCGALDGFVSPSAENVNFTSCSGGTGGCSLPASLTMASPATANNVISVGSYASKISWTDQAGASIGYLDGQALGAISQFSSWGPTRDGRVAPDVAAPGEGVGAALSSKTSICSTCTFSSFQLLQDGVHAILQGTSMAAPVVTGIIATRLQNQPARTVAQLRAILRALARSDAAVTAQGTVPNAAFGYGKVVASPQPVSPPNGLSAAALGVSSITWTWSTSLTAADSFDVYYATSVAAPLAVATQPPFTQTGLLGNATYGLLIRGVGGGIEGPGTIVTTATYAAAPNAAPSVTGWSSSATVTFASLQCPSFPAVGSCSGYIAQVGAASDFSGTTFSSATTANTLTTLQVSGLTPSSGYFLRLGNLNPLGAPAWGPFVTFNTGTNYAAPVSPTFDQISTGTIRFNWSQGSNPAGLTYVAQASTAADYSGTLYSVSGTALSATFPSLLADTSYYFRAQVVGGPFLTPGPSATLALPPAVSTNSFPAVGAAALTTAWSNAGDEPDTLYQADVAPVSDFSSGVVTVQTRTTAATFAGLSPNTAYWARVQAIARAGAATVEVPLGSTTTLVQAPTLPGQPFSAQATNGFTFAFLNGGNPAGTRFLVQVSTDPGFSVIAASSNTASTTATFGALLSNQSYGARVAGLNAAGSPTAFVSAATATAVAAPSTAVPAVTTRTATGFGFAWTPGTLAAGTSYVAQASSSPAFAFAVASSATANLAATYAGLQPNTTYYGQVLAVSQNPPTPNGPFLAAAAGATLPNAPGAAGAPFVYVFFTSATVAWVPLPLAPSSAAAEGYLVQFSTDPAFGSVWASSSLAPGASSATVSGLAFATTYYARVGALSWESYPNWSALGSTSTLLPPLSSGAVSGSGLTLVLPPAFAPITSIVVTVPPAAFPFGSTVTAVASLALGALGTKTNEAAGLTPFGTPVGIDLSAGGLQPTAPVRVSMTYDPLQIPAGQDERHLHLWRYDPPSAQWTLVASQDDPSSHTLNASVQHFSTFAPFFVTAGSNLSGVQVFPQPWEIPASGSQYWAPVLTFSGLPSGARVRLFTLTGEAIFDGTASGGGVLAWDGGTRYGKRAASGTYFAAFEANGQKFVRRVVIIR